jgi:hypothetical protein
MEIYIYKGAPAEYTHTYTHEMSGLYNYNATMDPGFDIRAKAQRLGDPGIGAGYPGNGPLSDRMQNPSGINKQYSQETNSSIKTTVRTRTRDQDQINQHQLAWMYTKNFESPVLLSLVQLNQILAGGDPAWTEETRKKWYDHGKKQNKDNDKNDPRNWSKEYVLSHFKLYGVVVNRDVDMPNSSMPMERVERTMTVCVKGSTQVLDYWSRKGNALRKYDMCYFVLKRVPLDHKKVSFQNCLTSRYHNAGSPMQSKYKTPKLHWQVFPYNVNDRCIKPSVYTTHVKNTHSGNTEITVGSYWRVGLIHEYASIGSQSMYEKRDENSVARDISYLSDQGAVRPMEIYLNLDDETKLV